MLQNMQQLKYTNLKTEEVLAGKQMFQLFQLGRNLKYNKSLSPRKLIML